MGTGPRGAELYREIQKNSSQQYHVLGFVDTIGDQVVAPEVRECLLGSLGDLERLLATQVVDQVFIPDSHFSFDSANHRVASDAFIYAGWKALKALRRSTPNG